MSTPRVRTTVICQIFGLSLDARLIQIEAQAKGEQHCSPMTPKMKKNKEEMKRSVRPQRFMRVINPMSVNKSALDSAEVIMSKITGNCQHRTRQDLQTNLERVLIQDFAIFIFQIT